MNEAVLKGKVRQTGRKGPARRIRAEGLLPGIIYGRGENVPVTVEAKAIKIILETKSGANSILTTKFEGDVKERTVMIKGLDVHPIYDTLLHIDLIEIDIDRPIKVAVALEFIGVSTGVKLKGGRMNTNLRSLKVQCLPKDIPPVIEVRVDELDIGDTLRVKDLKVDPIVNILNDPETLVVSVSEPKAEEEKVEEAELIEGEETAAAAEGESAEESKEASESKEPKEPRDK